VSGEGTIAEVLAGEKRWCVLQGDCLDVLGEIHQSSCVVVTDPPYGVGKQIAGDKAPWEVWLPWIDRRIAECCRVGRMVFAFWAATRIVRYIRESEWPPCFEINWHKPMMLHDTSLNGSPFLAHREAILYWGPMSPKLAGKRGYDSFAVNAMWPSQRRAEGIDHPTPKPLELLLQTIPYWTDETDIVIDPFCGSGTHLVAAVRQGRRAIGIDIDPQWVEASRQRLIAEENLTTLGDAKRGQGALFEAES
jgi:site-specific DNA-methyltransferase (adenine-specific)